MTWYCLRECRAQAEGRGSSAAADPKCQLPDPGEPVIASGGRKMQVITHAEVTLPVGMAVLSCTAVVLSRASLDGYAARSDSLGRQAAYISLPCRLSMTGSGNVQNWLIMISRPTKSAQSRFGQRLQWRCRRCWLAGSGGAIHLRTGGSLGADRALVVPAAGRLSRSGRHLGCPTARPSRRWRPRAGPRSRGRGRCPRHWW